jgi:palmitoyltransferase ZDHHC1/11
MDLERPRRVNGLSRPYTAAQISTWVFLPMLVLQFLFFAAPLLPMAASISCSIIFCGLAACSSYFGYLSMKVDPRDPRLVSNNPIDSFDGPTKQCWICDAQVGEKSMHCKFCNKCVDHFDHHCMCKYKQQHSNLVRLQASTHLAFKS